MFKFAVKRNIFTISFILVSLLTGTRPEIINGQSLENELANEIPLTSMGSCKNSGLCCPGRDSSCVVQKAKPNAIIEDLNDIPCYCDHACLTIGDCCPDFKTACGVFDCHVSNWGPWSECDQDCGSGVMTRTRGITQEPRNGGKPCPSLTQKRGCLGSNCQQNVRMHLEETAIILPAAFSQKRKINEGSDITRNLRLRYVKHPERERPRPYCVEFEVIRSTKACRAMESFRNLREGNRLCTLCEPDAQRFYGEYRCVGTGSATGSPTRFSSLREPACHGKWKHMHSGTKCGCANGTDFIFV